MTTTQDNNQILDEYENNLLNFTNLKGTYLHYKNDNLELIKNSSNTKSEITTNYRKTYYEQQGITNLKYYYSVLFYIYLFVCIAVIISIFTRNTNLSKVKLFIIVIFFISYPYVSGFIFLYLMKFYNAIINTFPKNVYKTI
jgi:hypothetical protein